MPKLAQILKRSSGSRQVCVLVFFFSDHCIKQIDSMLPCVCSVIDHRWRQCRKNKEVAHEPQASVSLLFLPHFDVRCDLLLNRRTATWNLFVKYIYIYIYIYIRVRLVHKIQEIFGYALFVSWITSIYLYDHVCIHLIEVCVIVFKKKRKWQIYAKIYPLHNLFHVW